VRRALRLARVGVHLAAGCALSALAYPLLPPGVRRAIRRAWARGLLDILSVRLVAPRAPLEPGCLLVANHVSWLDAVVLNALQPVAVVAKSEARRWPLIGALMARNETLFAERRPCRSLLALNAEIGARLARGEPVAVFPEGTTTDGAGVRAFRPALFEPAVRAGHPVRAVALAYRGASGARAAEAAFIDDMSLWESLVRIAALPALQAEVHDCGVLAGRGLTRRAAAARAHARIHAGICGAPLAAAAPGAALVAVALEPHV
jgi:1-acyl-sn-glycerol-3-phosphate acyltransferase